MTIPGRYAKQPVNRVGQDYQGALLQPILTEMDRELRRLRELVGEGTGSGTGAPVNAPYVTIGNDAILTSERGLVGSARISVTDGGANSSVTIDAPGSALTDVDDTNITVTLSGTPTTALLAPVTITMGWSGTLAIARGGTGQATALAAFNALSPLTTRGDLITRDATNNIRLAVGADSTLLWSDGIDPIWRTFLELKEVATPSNPASDHVRIFARANGSNIEIVGRSSTGAECVMCTLADAVVAQTWLLEPWGLLNP